ncbi:MAG: phage minor head protein [Acetobacter aceti]
MADDVAAILSAAPVRPSDAIAFVRQKTLVTTASFGELEQEAHARAFTSAGMTEMSMLRKVGADVSRAISEGMSYSEFQKRFLKIADDHDWKPRTPFGVERPDDMERRANLIYDTNMSMAYSAGEWKALNTPEAIDIYPWFQYRHHSCPHPRLQHLAWDGLILPRDDPFWITHWPPNGWRCHCTVEPVSRRDMRLNKWEVSESPAIRLVEKRNPATGRMVQVPEGIDLGFAYNPGRVWQADVEARAATAPKPITHINGIPKAEVAPGVREQAQVRQIGELLDKRAGSVEAGTLPEAVMKELGAADDSVVLDHDTIGKQGLHHGEIEREAYEAIPAMIARPEAVVREKENTSGAGVSLIGRHGNQLYKMVLRSRADILPGIVRLMSFHDVPDREARRLLRRSGITGEIPDMKKSEE